MEREQAALVASQESRLYAHPKTQQFLLEAIAEGAHLKTPERSNDQAWARKLNVLRIYYGTSATQYQIGEMLGLPGKDKRQRVQQLLSKGILQLWNNCSGEVKARHPRAEIKLRASKRSAEDRSRIRGGKLAEVKALFMQGESLEEIAKQTGKTIAYVKHQLRKSSLVPESNYERTKRLLDAIRVAASNEEIKQIFEQIKDKTFAQSHRELFVPIKNLAGQIGFRFDPRELKDFVKVLKDADIPYLSLNIEIRSGKKTGEILKYYFVLARQVPEVAGVFLNTRELEKFRQLKSLRQVAGPRVDLPSTNSLKHRRGYKVFLKEISTLGVNKEKLFSDCPVPVFRCSESYIVHESDFETLIDYAKKIAAGN